MKAFTITALMISALAVAGCQSASPGRVAPAGKASTPSGGIVPAQTPE